MPFQNPLLWRGQGEATSELKGSNNPFFTKRHPLTTHHSLLTTHKLQRHRVYAMPYIFWREVFAFKNMSQMSAAIGAYDLDTPAIRVGHPLYCARYFIIKTWPAAMRFEL